MAATLDTLVKETRRFLRDWPAPASALTLSLGSTDTSVTVADTTVLPANYTIEVDYEVMLVTTSNSSTNTSVLRGWAGTAAVSHANSSTVIIRPGFYSSEIVDALNAAKDEMYPYVYKPVLDTSLTPDGATYEFTIPAAFSHLSRVEVKVTGDLRYREIDYWDVRRGSTPLLKFRRLPAPGTLRLHGFGKFDDLVDPADTLDTLFPGNAVHPMTMCAASRLLASGEAGRSRMDVGARDDREAANKPGNAIALSNSLYQRYLAALQRVSMPPMGTHIVQVI